MNLNKRSKIFLAGHRGMVGSSILRYLKKKNYKNVITINKNKLDLLNQAKTEKFIKKIKPDFVIIAAAKVGGILANENFKADFIYQNLVIQTNIIHSSYIAGVKKLIFLGSSCIYPKYSKQPIKEESLLSGNLEPTNDAYAIAKISGIKMLQAYYKQYGMKSVSLMPSNLYGPGDNFHPDNGHVIPAMMTKFQNSGGKSVMFWGDGTPKREFLYSEDLADACLFAMDHFENAELINVGSGENVSIKELSNSVASVVKYDGEIKWDTSRPNGTPNRPLDCSKMTKLGWKPKHTLSQGLQKTYDWFIENTDLQTK